MRQRSIPALVVALTAFAACASDSEDASTDTSPPVEATDTDAEPDADTESQGDEAQSGADEADPDGADDAAPEDEPPTTEPAPPPAAGSEVLPIGDQPHGSNVLASSQGYTETVDALRATIEGNDALTLVAELDHAANAANAGLELPPTTVFLFGNPALGTPLMQENPASAIDLPQRMLVTEDLDGTVQIWWNDPNFVASRHGLGPASLESLATIDGALTNIASAAASTEEAPVETFPVIGEGDGIVVIPANGTVREVTDRLLAAIDGNDALGLVAEVDHAANAASVDLELPDTITVLFGNPNLGTPLMRESRTIGLDLPQKVTIHQTDSGVEILYNDPVEFASRHDIDDEAEPIPTIAGALDGLLNGVAAG